VTWSWLFYLACALLVAGGGYLVARDLMVGRADVPPKPDGAAAPPATPHSTVSQPRQAAPPRDADVVIRTRQRHADPPSSTTPVDGGAGAFDRLLTTIATIRAGDEAMLPAGDTDRVADLPDRFRAVEPLIGEAIAYVNAAVAPIGLESASPAISAGASPTAAMARSAA
jgi:hypothetical protein